MPDPRVFIVRHGETEWSLNGRHTGTTELPLTAAGEKRIRATGRALVGDDRLIVPGNLAHIYVSPRHRAQRTLELLNLGCQEEYPWHKGTSSSSSLSSSSPSSSSKPAASDPAESTRTTTAHITVDPRVCEWNYGSYEGLTSSQIRQSRSERRLPANWDIWRDGCEGGESPEDVAARLDELIEEMREKWHEGRFGKGSGWKGKGNDGGGGGGGTGVPNDVLIVAHGHVLRSFAARWVGKGLKDNPSLILEAGGVGTLSYEHHSIDEPAILLGGAFVVEMEEKLEEKLNT
ncbi:phosphoglycerate mutase-like protein [Pleomassaria siparia CBS 279.74]|uniref:Phosphoglycerate mutase-like protein n=1 Tax=Pleomassaria siparia CBS 279.74 TaxID=1314801 RepID=A0A6G1KII7_9PLEO|nr:phosphoglycerate mutase-like protein [Pleomassaria siparia CBS 279.74]